MRHVMQQKNFGRGRVINMEKNADYEALINDIKNGNVQGIDWAMMCKIVRYLIDERDQENDLK